MAPSFPDQQRAGILPSVRTARHNAR